jgi:NAD(P)-dependent dehydrogenase (short-subunit alcohol dehydrogenase family)
VSTENGPGRVAEDLGGADILVNNAGVMLLGPFSAELRSSPSPSRGHAASR